MTPSDNPLLIAALDYAARGWPVFPCNPTTKAPLLKGDVDAAGKTIPRTGGVKKASTDAATITGWWERWPKALIGCATGVAFWVVDFDPREDVATGEVWTLERLKGEVEAQIGVALPATLASRTQSGGVHLFFALPDDGGPAVTNRGNLPQHVDVRGLGGYVIVPPSVMQSGASYHWLRGDGGAAIAPAPVELLAVLRASGSEAAGAGGEGAGPSPAALARESTSPRRGEVGTGDAVRRYALSAFDLECQALRSAGDGDRNNALNRVAFSLGTLVGAGALDKAMVRAALVSIASAWPNLPKSEGTIDSGLDGGIGQPRDLRPIEREAEERAAKYTGSRARGAAKPQQSPARTAAPAQPAAAQSGGRPSFAPAPPEGETFSTTSHSGASRGRLRRRSPEEREERRVQLSDHFAYVLNRRCAGLQRTDLGNAERFKARAGINFRWCSDLESWLAWDGTRWKIKGAAELVLRAVYDVVRAIPKEADAVFGTEDDVVVRMAQGSRPEQRLSAALRAHAVSSEGNARLKCIADLAKPFLSVAHSQLDQDPMMINVANGTLIARRAHPGGFEAEIEHRRHRRLDLITKLAPVVYDPTATCPTYDRFLEKSQPSEGIRRFLHDWNGYSLTGHVGEQKLVYHYGEGRNGKGTMMEAHAFVAGDYAETVGIETFLDQGVKRKGSDASPDIAKLPGIRMLRTTEPEEGSVLAEGLIKKLTGQDPIDARKLRSDFFTFKPSFKLAISGNHMPRIKGVDEGIWSRVRFIPWNVIVAANERDPDLPEKLQREASGILNHLLEGLRRWLDEGLVWPQESLDMTQAYRDKSDVIGRFLNACTKPVPGARVQSSALSALYAAWAKASGEALLSPKALSNKLTAAPHKLVKDKSSEMYWLGIEVTMHPEDYLDAFGNVRKDLGEAPKGASDDPGYVPD